MIRKISILSIIALAALTLTMCKANTYADQRKAEKAKLSSFIQKNGLIIKEGVNDSTELINASDEKGKWPDKVWFKTYNGAYVRIDSINKEERQPAKGNTIIMRWKTYDLDGNLTGDNTDPSSPGGREGMVFVYTPGSTTPSPGWNACIPFMRHNCQAQFIIESVIGPAEQQQAVVALKVSVLDFTVKN